MGIKLEDYKLNKSHIAQGCLTNSKHEDRFIGGIYPKLALKGRNSTLMCDDGKDYIDFICGLGTNLLGYSNRWVNQEIFAAINNGITHSLPTPYEGKAAKYLKILFPFCKKFKFVMSGSEACLAAIKMARAHTKRELVLSQGYHGWPYFPDIPNSGYTDQPNLVEMSNLLYYDPKKVAAIIVEPIVTDHSPARIQWLADLRKYTEANGIVLIFDEVITGFRYLKYGVSNHYKITPDLICLGKAMGSGMPIACVAGREDIMDGNYFVSSTNAGSLAGLAACIETCKQLLTSTDYKVEKLWEHGESFLNRFNKISDSINIKGYPTRGVFVASDKTKALFFQEACKAGILFGPSWFFNFDHIPDIEFVLESCSSIIRRIDLGEIELEGKMPSSPFAAKVRQNG